MRRLVRQLAHWPQLADQPPEQPACLSVAAEAVQSGDIVDAVLTPEEAGVVREEQVVVARRREPP